MSEVSKSEIMRKFRERVDRGTLAEDIKLIYRIAGGLPTEQVEEEFRLYGSGKADVVVRDALKSMPIKEVSGEIDQAETRDLLQQIESGLDSLTPRSEARFLPDSVVGSITIQVGQEETTLYFLADEGERLAQAKPISPQMTEAIQRIRNIWPRLLKNGREREK
jgi:hypothetical protein